MKIEVSVSSMICASLKEALGAIGGRQSDERNVSSPAEDPHVLIMDFVRVDHSETETLCQVSGQLWRKTVLTSCVLAGCLALLVLLTL
jgi:hypothetical protein